MPSSLRVKVLVPLALALIATVSTTSLAGKEGDAVKLDTSKVRAGGTPVGDLIRVPITRTAITENVFHASGLSNAYLVNTPDGAVVIDTGFAHQAKRQMELLQEVATGPVKYIFIPQGQADDVAGIPMIRNDDTQIIMTRSSRDYMPWRKEVSDFLLPRYAALYSWTNELQQKGKEKKKTKNPFPYEPIEPDILVEDHVGYEFELGGVRFEVIALPGAEGANSAGLWMPDEKILFIGGGFLGPEIPMWPNFGTVRADKDRWVDEYLASLDKALALDAKILLPGQDDPVIGADKIRSDMTLIRDAVSHVRNEVITGLTAGKDVYELMRDIELPEHLAHLSQSHGRVEWTIRNMVNHYGAWFSYRYTSELYPYRTHTVFPALVELAGAKKVLKKAREHMKDGQLEHAILLVEAVLEAEPASKPAMELQVEVLSALLDRAKATHQTFSEIAWLQKEIKQVGGKLAQ